MGWFSMFLMSRASGWLAVVALAALSALGWYIQDLKIDAARCAGQDDIRGQLEVLTDKVVKDIDEHEDANVRAVREASGPCLGERVPDVIVDGLRDD